MGSADNMTSKPCCPSTTPPVVTVDGVEDYELKGSWKIIDGLKTYVSGPADAKKGILVIYDIFGFFPQTLRGADLIASVVDGIEEGYRVFMPDFFEGEPADIAWYPPETEDQGKKLMQWFSTRSPDVVGMKRIPAWLKAPEVVGIEEWGIVGYCWGGKVVSLICSEAVETKSTGMQGMRNKFKVAVQCHPGLIDSSDALEITTPTLVLASMEEPVQDVTVYGENLRGEKRVEWFKNMVHGWMSARGDLGDVVVKEEYERAYVIVGPAFWTFLYPLPKANTELQRQLTVTTSSQKKRKLSQQDAKSQDSNSSADIPRQSVEGRESQSPTDDIPRFDFPTPTPFDSALPPPIPTHLQTPSSSLVLNEYTSSAASSPSALYAGLSIEGGEQSGSEFGTASFAASEQDTRSQSPIRTFSHRAIMGGAADVPQRSSSPLKRPASDLEVDGKDDVDMITVPTPGQAEPTNTSKSSPLANRAQSVDMLGPDEADVSNDNTKLRRKSQEIPPIDHQIQTVTTIVEANEQVPPKEGDKLYLVSLRWLNRVKARGSAAKQNSKEEPEGEVGPIDNSDIIQQIGKDSDGKDYVQLKPGIGSESFLPVPEDAWDLIVSWYGLMPGSIPIVRTAHNTNPDKWALPNVIYEWHPLVLVVHRLWSHNNPLALPADLKRLDPPTPIFVLSRTTKYHEFLKLIKTKTAIDLTRKVRVWRVPRIQPASETVAPVNSAATPPSSRPVSPTAENVSAPTGKAPQDSWTKLLLDVESFTKLESGVEREKLDLVDNTNNKNYNGNMDLATAGLGEDQTIVLDEYVSQDMYVCNYIPKQDRSTSIVVTKSGKKANNQTNSGRNSPAPIGPVTRGRIQRSGKTVGCVGLSNLGNTCYMNSALQCVRSVEELTKYFLSKTSEEELNTDNPLGNNGEVAMVYGHLLQEMYKDPVPGSIAPRYFKNTIGKYAPSFSGYGQQDSQEFLGFLLDGLQEDLSRVKKKPYIEKPDSTDEMVNNEELIREMAAKVWDITKKRDDSVIADLFTGMYKSTLVCPECSKVSITFDPFNNLTLQLPIENVWHHDIVYFPLSDSPIRISVDLDKNGSIKALKQFVSDRVHVPIERLFCAENWKEKFYKVHDDMKCASEEIGQSDNCNIYELEAVPTNWPAPKKQTKKGKMKTIYSSNLDSSDDDVPNWDSPLAERMVVPVYHRAINNDRGRNNRTKAHKWTLAPHIIILTPQEARSEDMVRRKILEKVATFTTYSFVTNDTDSSSPESPSESVDPDLVVTTGSDADSAGDGKVVAHSIDGEDGLVNVSMKNSASVPDSSDANDKKTAAQTPKPAEHKFNTRRPLYLDPKVFLEPEVQNMFDLSYYTGANELVPLGWQSVQEEKTYPLLSSRNPQLQQPIHEADDYDMTNGRGSETSDDDTLSSNNAISTTRMTEESDDSEDELAKNFNRSLPDRPKAPRSGFKVGFGNKRRSHLKTYSKKGNKPPPKLPHSEAFDHDAPVDGPLVRLGEGIIVDWKQNAFETIFCADDPQDTLRGQSKLEAVNIPLLPDENLEVKRKTRLARRKNGITLDDCLDEFGKEEILSEQDTWYCPRCKEHRRASKKFELWKIPDILVMHLKRFSSSGIRRDKLDVLVDFPIEGLDLSSRVIEHEDGKSEIYDLFAVDDHWGGLGGGHYTAFAKNFNDNQWYEYNDSSVSKVADPQRVVSPSAYLLFYRRRSDVPLGGPRLKAIVESFDSPNDSSDDETSDSGEGQGLVGNSSLHGSSRALTGAGAVHPQQNLGSSGKEMTTVNPQDLDELPPYENQDLNDGMQLQNSIEEDEGISMNDNTITAFTANWSGWSNMPGLGTDNPERPSGAGSDMDVQSDGEFSNRSDIVQDNSSCGSAVRAGRIIDFEDTPAVNDNGDPWVDESLVPDIDDGRVDMYDFQHTLQLSKHSVPLQQFNVPAAGPEIEEEVDEPATDIHVEEGEGLKIE